jgi:hypothetical protein
VAFAGTVKSETVFTAAPEATRSKERNINYSPLWLLELDAELELLLVTLLLEELLDELCELAELELLLDKLLDEDELALDELEELELLLELDDDKSSIDKICIRSPERGPGNCNEPVWKFSTSLRLTSPDVLVSVRTACQIVLSVRSMVTFSVAPARSVL